MPRAGEHASDAVNACYREHLAYRAAPGPRWNASGCCPRGARGNPRRRRPDAAVQSSRSDCLCESRRHRGSCGQPARARRAGRDPASHRERPTSAGAYTSYRHFRAERVVQTPITVTYRMRPVSEYLTGINQDARSYYANPFRDLSSDSIRRIGFSTGFGRGGAQNLAYTRGSLFWADVDTRIRETTSGRRKLDECACPAADRAQAGKAVHGGRGVQRAGPGSWAVDSRSLSGHTRAGRAAAPGFACVWAVPAAQGHNICRSGRLGAPGPGYV
jgi:hypothetical protein